MELMYMNHINFRPVEHGKIYQSVKWTNENMAVRTSIPEHVKASQKYIEFLSKLKENPGLTREINPDDEYNPEIAFFMNAPGVDKDGIAHYMQLHPDGSARFIFSSEGEPFIILIIVKSSPNSDFNILNTRFE